MMSEATARRAPSSRIGRDIAKIGFSGGEGVTGDEIEIKLN